MKKAFSLLLAAVLFVGCFTACGRDPGQPAGNGGAKQIVTTIFPVYDWIMNLLGENPAGFEVAMLLDSGVDLHSYQPTADDMKIIATCDLFVYVGGESDEWVDDALQEAVNSKMTVVKLLDVLGNLAKEEELVEGMQAEEEHEAEEAEEEVEYDEHVWLSLRSAAKLVQSLADSLQKIDADHAAVYQANASAYVDKLNALDAQYETAVASAAVKTLLFGDRFPFRYLADDYGLTYYAAFAGCSAETEASFETVRFLARKVDELSLHAVMTIEGTDHRIAQTIVQSTQTKDQQILTLDSMQSATAKDVENGTTYLAVMERNLSVLKSALQ